MIPEMGEIHIDQTLTLGSGDKEISVLLLKEEIGLGLIGMLTSKLFSGNVALVAVTGSPEDTDFNIGYHGHSRDGKAERIGLDEKLIDGLRAKSDEALFVLLHEVGHLVNKDVVAVGEDFERYNQTRIEKVKSGEVLEMELRADIFAVEYLGIQVSINGLHALMERERAYYLSDTFDREEVETALAETEYRIKNLESIQIQNKT